MGQFYVNYNVDGRMCNVVLLNFTCMLIALDQKPAPALSGTLHSDNLFITTRGDQTTNMTAAARLSASSKVKVK